MPLKKIAGQGEKIWKDKMGINQIDMWVIVSERESRTRAVKAGYTDHKRWVGDSESGLIRTESHHFPVRLLRWLVLHRKCACVPL